MQVIVLAGQVPGNAKGPLTSMNWIDDTSADSEFNLTFPPESVPR